MDLLAESYVNAWSIETPQRDKWVRELAWIYDSARDVYPLAKVDTRRSQYLRRRLITWFLEDGLIEVIPRNQMSEVVRSSGAIHIPTVKAFRVTRLGRTVIEELVKIGRVRAAFWYDWPSVPKFVRNDPLWHPREVKHGKHSRRRSRPSDEARQ